MKRCESNLDGIDRYENGVQLFLVFQFDDSFVINNQKLGEMIVNVSLKFLFVKIKIVLLRNYCWIKLCYFLFFCLLENIFYF